MKANSIDNSTSFGNVYARLAGAPKGIRYTNHWHDVITGKFVSRGKIRKILQEVDSGAYVLNLSAGTIQESRKTWRPVKNRAKVILIVNGEDAKTIGKTVSEGQVALSNAVRKLFNDRNNVAKFDGADVYKIPPFELRYLA